MDFKNVLVSIENGISILTINRPDKLNALNKTTIDEIGEWTRNLVEDKEVFAGIITGSGPKAFVAGADISEFLNYSQEEGRNLSAQGHGVFNQIEQCPKPVAAAINGFALGGGLELAMACHLRIASNKAKFGQPEVNLGLIPGYGGTQRLVRLVGRTKALEWLMTAEMVEAEKALYHGLVNEVVEPENLLHKTIELLEKIHSKSPMAISEVIRCVNGFSEPGTDGLSLEISRFAACFGTPEFKEGVSAFLEKRNADFSKKA